MGPGEAPRVEAHTYAMLAGLEAALQAAKPLRSAVGLSLRGWSVRATAR
jgi:hypothetical protein